MPITGNIAQEPGKSLSKDEELMKGCNFSGVVKAVGIYNKGLSKFCNNHFTYPLYNDDAFTFYNNFFGKRKLSLMTYSLLKLYSGYKQMQKCLKEKKLEGNMAVDGMVHGRVIISNKAGKAMYVHEGATGKKLVMDDIVAVLRAV